MRERILSAIRTNRKLDFSDGVLRGEKDLEGKLRPPLGPVLHANFQRVPKDEFADRSVLTTRDIETLSLAARHALLGGMDEHSEGAPVWMKNCSSGFAIINAADICSAVAEAGHGQLTELSVGEHDVGVSPGAARHGLHIVGARIVGELDLINVRAPFAIRLVGCVIDGPLRLSHAQIQTVDLTGSAVRGVFATFLHCRSVRMRRVFSSSVVDFGGARIDGILDASDCVVVPQDAPPAGEAFVGERGVFNCSLAHIEKEMRLSRSRIYGGLSMMGTVINGSLFMTDAVLRSPLATLETLAYTTHKSAPMEAFPGRYLQPSVRAHGEADEHLAAMLHIAELKESRDCRRDNVILGRCSACRDSQTCKAREYEYRMAIECLIRHSALLAQQSNGRNAWKRVQDSALLMRILGEHLDARISAWRAQGATVRGSVHAAGMRAGGGLRLKYLTVTGSLQLEGVRLRSPAAVRAGLDTMIAALPENRQKWFRRVRDENSPKETGRVNAPEVTNSQQCEAGGEMFGSVGHLYAVDLRYARVGGDVSMAPKERRSETREAMMRLSFLSWSGGRDASKTDEELSEHLSEQIAASIVDGGNAALDETGVHYAHNLRSRIIGGIHAGSAHIGGELDLTGLVASNITGRPGRVGFAPEVPRHFLDFSYSTIERGVDLKETVGLNGVCGQYAILNGPLKFCSMEDRRDNPPTRRALLLAGEIVLVGAAIKGDALFLFDREAGPSLKMKRSVVGGRLYIVPRNGNLNSEVIDYPAFQQSPVGISEADPEIDLRNVTSPVFMHAQGAWPKQGLLQVEGFAYLRVRRTGPLTPAGSEEGVSQKSKKSGSLASLNWLRRGSIFGSFITVCIGLVLSIVLLVAFGGDGDLVAFLETSPTALGLPNLIAVAIWIAFLAIQYCVRHMRSPAPHDVKPRGIAWLSLQKRRPNPYGRKKHMVPLQPFVQAARVLSAAGHYEAAQRIELERLRERSRIWSFRLHPWLKIGLGAADLFFKYGFAPMRAFGFAVGTVLFGGLVFHSADMCAQMQPVAGDVVAAAFRLSGGTTGQNDQSERRAQIFVGMKSGGAESSEQGFGATAIAPYPRFISMLYALDVVVPMFDLGQEQHWAPSQRPMLEGWSNLRYCAKVADTPFYVIFHVLLKVLGWMFTTLIAIAVLTRAETLVARNQE